MELISENISTLSPLLLNLNNFDIMYVISNSHMFLFWTLETQAFV